MKTEININDICGTLVSVKLTIRKWTGASSANEVAREVETSKGTRTGAVGATVFYLPDDISHELGTLDSQLATCYKLRTLPFEDGGWRVVMADGFLPLLDAIAEPKNKRDAFVTENIIKYRDVLESKAQKDLGTLFKKFPSVEELQDKYRIDFSSRPIHAGNDIRIKGLSEQAVEMVRTSERQIIAESLRTAIDDITNKLRWLCEDMAGRIGKDTQKRTRYGGHAEKVREICGSLKSLNILKDPTLDKLIADTQAKLTMFTPDALRSGGWATNVMESNVKSLLADIDKFGVNL